MVKAADVPQDILNRWKGLSSSSSSSSRGANNSDHSTSNNESTLSSISGSSAGSSSYQESALEPTLVEFTQPSEGSPLSAAADNHGERLLDEQHLRGLVDAASGPAAAIMEGMEGSEHGDQSLRASSAQGSAERPLERGHGEGSAIAEGVLEAGGAGSAAAQGGKEGLGLLDDEELEQGQEQKGEVKEGFRPAFAKDRYLCK